MCIRDRYNFCARPIEIEKKPSIIITVIRIRQKIRKVDVCTRYSSMQYLIILFEPDEKTIPNIMERIFGQYREQCGKKKLLLNYEYMSMTEK